MASAEELPNDALVAIFSYLRATESITCRGVCRKWSKSSAGAGTLQIQVRRRCKSDKHQEDFIWGVTFFGRVKKRKQHQGDAAALKIFARSGTYCTSFPERIRGHLPSPASQTIEDVSDTAPATASFVCDQLSDVDHTHALNAGMVCTLTTKHPCYAAIQLESSLQIPFITIDLGSTSSKFQHGVRHEQLMICREKRLCSLRSSIIHLNTSCLKQLRVISVAGCGNLKSLLLPSSIKSTDAKGCTELLRIGFPNGCDGSLQSLDLNGCRSLRRYKSKNVCSNNYQEGILFGTNSTNALRSITHLDMSQLLDGTLDEEFCAGLKSTASLEMFSLRYCASDAIIMALAQSQSSRNGQLRLVDIAFSVNVTDESVKLLVRNSPALERINMRGCKGITGECYNNVPVFLERRRSRGGSAAGEEEVLAMDDSFPSSRKGDNLFYFCKQK